MDGLQVQQGNWQGDGDHHRDRGLYRNGDGEDVLFGVVEDAVEEGEVRKRRGRRRRGENDDLRQRAREDGGRGNRGEIQKTKDPG